MARQGRGGLYRNVRGTESMTSERAVRASFFVRTKAQSSSLLEVISSLLEVISSLFEVISSLLEVCNERYPAAKTRATPPGGFLQALKQLEASVAI